METLVLFMMILVCLSFVLKQTFHNVKEIMAAAVVLLFFVGMMWTFAAEQSKTQVAAWIADQQLMLDMAVLMSVDVALTMFFCVFHVDIKTSEHVSKAKRTAYTVLKYFPGLLVFPVVFSFLVMLVFVLPGVSFQTVSWGLGAVVFLLVPTLTYGLKWLLPESAIRLEMLFLLNVVLGLAGIVGTVNGKTAVSGINDFDVRSLVSVVAIVVVGMAVGMAYYRWREQRMLRKMR